MDDECSLPFKTPYFVRYSKLKTIYSLPGPPLTNNSAVMELVANNVAVGLGCEEMWSSTARNLPFNIGWVRDNFLI